MATKNKSIQWTVRADSATAVGHILAAAKSLKFKASSPGDGQVLVESPFSMRSNTFPGKYSGSITSDGTMAVIVWTITGQGSNLQRNLEKMAEQLPAGVLEDVGPVAESNANYRAKHGIPDDAVLAVGVGGYCAFDGQFLTIQHTGVLGRMTVGKGVKRVPLGSVSAVQIKPAGPVVSGFIQFTVPGGNEQRSEFGKQTWDAAGDENSVVFYRDQEPAFLTFRDALEAAITSRQNPAPATAPAATSVLDQLSQLAGLRDSGVLTAAEFDAKKAELLGRL
ncbi:DUF4429 domain-containing protein [Arthrobacter zhaoguopingii]|uniref:DUF4429 domain-containing protein n=1 Tax=Arthrobacter zhaoguopingii TaxID=2681491 RepID=UPI001914F8D7|nr:DUF4429 domain-containing protein [Arthrobacter zhaoguopingii]